MSNVIGYAAVFIKSENGYYVEFPDLAGCFSQGNSLEESICNSQEALAIYYIEKNGELPSASSLQSIQQIYPDAIIQIIAIDTENFIVKPLRSVKKTLTIPEWLNILSEKYHVNFSQILRTALINHLSNLDSISPHDMKMLKS